MDEYFKIRSITNRVYYGTKRPSGALYVGGTKQRCAQLSTKSHDTMILSHIQNKEGCSLFQEISYRGPGVDLLQVSIEFVHKMYPNIKYIEFEDASNITCNNGATNSLSAYSIIQGKGTWYEYNFNAIIEDELKESYIKHTKRLYNPNSKVEWDEIKLLLERKAINTECINIIKETYINSTTYYEFFTNLYKKVGKITFCNITANWIEEFLQAYLQMPYIFKFPKFYIPVTNKNTITEIHKVKDNPFKDIKQRGGEPVRCVHEYAPWDLQSW